jgi:hypothetical protein
VFRPPESPKVFAGFRYHAWVHLGQQHWLQRSATNEIARKRRGRFFNFGTATEQGKQSPMHDPKMQLGNFSVSLTVKDLKTSKAFYENLDFKHIGGQMKQNYVIMQNGTATIGLFQGMFEKNILTFNPGWNRDAETLNKFQDVRDLQATLK